MDRGPKHIVKAAVLILAFIVLISEPRGQTRSPSPTVPGGEANGNAGTDQAPTDDLWHRSELTDDWGGTRSRWKEHGLEMTFTLAGFVQGTAAGGLRRDTEWNGKWESEFDLDFEKLWGWKNWSGVIKAEYRFGGPVLGGTGAINTVNTDVIVPASQGSVFAVTAVNFTRNFEINSKKGELIAVSFGRFNTLDIQEKFFGGAGLDKFFNVAQIGPLTALRQVPNVTNGAGVDYQRNGESFISFGILDPNDHSTNVGLDHLFADGVTLSPVINLPTKWFGRSGKHTFSYTVTTKKYTPFDAIKQVVIPGPPVNPIQPKGGSSSISYVGRQYIVDRGPDDGWGVFTQVSFADRNTSPVTKFLDIGIGGNGIFTGRRQDDFGIAYAYTGLSSVLKENLNVATLGNVRPHAEHQFEGFYNFHLAPWLKLTGDMQIIRPVVSRAKTAVIPGGRLEVIF
jgi:porin